MVRYKMYKKTSAACAYIWIFAILHFSCTTLKLLRHLEGCPWWFRHTHVTFAKHFVICGLFYPDFCSLNLYSFSTSTLGIRVRLKIRLVFPALQLYIVVCLLTFTKKMFWFCSRMSQKLRIKSVHSIFIQTAPTKLPGIRRILEAS